MTAAQATELIDLNRRLLAAVEQLVAARPRSVNRKMHPKRFIARALGISRNRLARYIAAGVVKTVRMGKRDRVADEELQHHLAAGLPELEELQHRRPARVRSILSAPRPAAKKPGDAIRALRLR